jgi:2-iminobutanoate/2-iminopropanoate deaminase
MSIRHTPDTVAAPFGPYSHAVEVPEASRLFYIAGEVGVLPDGNVPVGIEAQAEVCWRNIIAILADVGMGVGDLVKITTYLVQPGGRGRSRRAEGKHFGDARPNTRRGLAPLQRPSKLVGRDQLPRQFALFGSVAGSTRRGTQDHPISVKSNLAHLLAADPGRI